MFADLGELRGYKVSRYLSHTPTIQYPSSTDTCSPSVMIALYQYTYVFVVGTFFALLDAYNNGASE
jgi:hypothetical protein